MLGRLNARWGPFPVPLAIGGGVALLAGLSLLLPFAPLYDPWAWLVWGREVVSLDLDTAAGPSWKPLPVLIDSVLALAGDAAPALWLVVARAGWIAAPLLAGALAARLVFPRTLANQIAAVWARRRVRLAQAFAGALAALGVLLFDDSFTSWTRQFAGGLSEPLLVALVLGAIHLDLSARRAPAFALGVLAALLRPEAWPFLALYGIHLWRAEPRLRRWLAAGGLAIPLLWLLPDLIGSGSPFTGASRAREGSGSPPVEALEAIGRALDLALYPLWLGAAYAVVSARSAGERAIPVLAAGAAAWIVIVAVLAAAGYAGIPRFAAPAAAVGCVLGAVGIVRALAALDGMRAADRARPAAIVVVALALVVLSAQAAIRAERIPGALDQAAEYADGIDELSGLVDDLGAEQVTACGPVTTSHFLAQTPLAWDLELPIDAISVRAASAPPAGVAFLDLEASAAARSAIIAAGRPLGERGRWSAYAISCSGVASSRGERAIAGVAGASR